MLLKNQLIKIANAYPEVKGDVVKVIKALENKTATRTLEVYLGQAMSTFAEDTKSLIATKGFSTSGVRITDVRVLEASSEGFTIGITAEVEGFDEISEVKMRIENQQVLVEAWFSDYRNTMKRKFDKSRVKPWDISGFVLDHIADTLE